MNFFVLGLGESGMAVAKFLKNKNYHVEAWDDEINKQDQANKEGIALSYPSCWQNNPVVIVAPGIGKHPLKQSAELAGLELVSDIQLFFRFFPETKAIGVTGSVGKSTTCSLIHHALIKQGCLSVLAGNIGIPIFSTVDRGKAQDAIYILEFSSYQLELCFDIKLKIGVLLNIVPHHLERHGSMAAYSAIKEKILSFAETKIVGNNQYLNPKWLEDKDCITFNENDLSSVSLPITLRTSHNMQNAAAAYKVLKLLEKKPIFDDFVGLRHRLEWVGQFQGIAYWNDSKATTPHSAASAIDSMNQRPLYWICGGVLQNDDLSVLISVLSRVTCAFVIGESGKRYEEFLERFNIPVTDAGTVDNAVKLATFMAKALQSSANILFSPGSASFDQFTNFEQRGDTFISFVKNFWKNREVA